MMVTGLTAFEHQVLVDWEHSKISMANFSTSDTNFERFNIHSSQRRNTTIEILINFTTRVFKEALRFINDLRNGMQMQFMILFGSNENFFIFNMFDNPGGFDFFSSWYNSSRL